MTATDEQVSGAIDVIVVDAEEPAPGLLAVRPDGTRSRGAWLVVRSGGQVLALTEVDLLGRDEVSSAEVRRLADAVTPVGVRPALDTLPDAALPSVSVVVCTDLRRTDQLRTCLTALEASDHPDVEVVVVDNSRAGDPDGQLADLVFGRPRFRVVRESVPGLSAARNAGLAAARGEVVAFTDDDVTVDRGWVRAVATRFALRPEESAVTGCILPAELETDAQLWFERHYGGFGGVRTFTPLSYRGGSGSIARRAKVTVLDWAGAEVRRFAVYGAGVCGAGANMSFRTEALRRLGGFDVALGAGTRAKGGEDLAAVIRLLWDGQSVGYEPAAVVFHTHRADYPSLRAQVRGYGLGFTAMLTSLVWGDPRHLLGMAAQVPAVVRQALRSRRAAAGTTTQDPVMGAPVPAELVSLERKGSLAGHLAYVRSRLESRSRARGR